MLAACLVGASPAPAAQTFRYTWREPLHAVDPATGHRLTAPRQPLDEDERDTLGVTGSMGISRRTVWVDEEGQLFVQARLPQSMAAQPHELDVYVQDGKRMSLRGTLRYTPGKGLLVAKTFVFPDLPEGPVVTEVHARGAHGSDWQEIVTQPVEVARGSRLRFSFALRGDERQDTPMDLVVETRDELDPSRPAATIFRRRVRPGAGRTDWKEAVESVSDVAGRRVRFAFRSRPADKTDAAAGVVWGAAELEREEKRRAFPLLLLVSLDSLRVNSVGLYSGGDATPAIDRFFRSGAVMMQAVTQSVTTLPAHMTLLTGLTPPAHGVVDERHRLSSSVETLARVLQARGWRTAAFTEGGALAAEAGFARGFDLYDEGKTERISPANADALARAAAYLDEHSAEPLFLFVHTYRTRPVHTGADVRSESARRRELASMVEQVRSADEALGKLLGILDGRTVQDESLYVLTSGHGEEFFEHGAGGHGTHLYEEAVRVPLLLRNERIGRARAAHAAVGLVDLARTVLELLDIDAPASMQGRSFASLLTGDEEAAMPRRFIEARRPLRLLDDGSLIDWGAPAFAVREMDRKVIFHPAAGTLEAYDLSRDPRETRNLMQAGRGPRWAQELADAVRDHASLRRVAPAPPANLSPINRRRLQSLGYLQ